MPNDKPSAAEKVGTLLTTEELAQQLKVKPSYLDWLRHRHDLPWVRVGGEVRYDTTAVRAWLQQRAAGAPKGDSPAVLTLRGWLKGKIDFAQWGALHKHIVALACYRGADGEDLLEQAFKDVASPAYRRVLLAVFAVTRQMTEAAYYHEHSALADSDGGEEQAKLQIRDAHENRERHLGGIVMRLVDDVPRYIEAPLTKFLAGDAAWAGLAVDGLADVAIAVATIRELCTGESDIETAKMEHSK